MNSIYFILYSIFVGPPTTGKSQVIKECAISPMESVTAEADSASPVIQKYTSSGMIKPVAHIKRGFLLSAEIYDVLFKLLKSDEENATGDVQALCQLFSGEEASYRYATEKSREVAANTPFFISGATQIPFAARLVALLDQGNGLLDRFLITFPKCLRPAPYQTSQAIESLKESALSSLSSIGDVFVEIARLHLSHSTYTLNQEAKETMNTVNEEFITEVNEAMLEGTTPPKTKKIDIILRVAAALHIFNHVTAELLQRRKPTQPADEIEHSTLLCAIDYVAWTESQKEIFVERRMKIMILPKLALSVMNASLESIARFADAETLQQIVNRVDLYLHDAESSLLDYETRDIVEKRNEIFKAVLEYTKAVVERELSDEKDGHECGR
ncbi:hypothetical protein AWC38_SpisGene21343 [Stylophora pistillata]|uniref:Uncharacterized protein n=1 Tax=Stylophora pistillata TaxID=50429 RepID=A0A2B4RCH8_STYPI|nr:hypothetical protein AWC38_SpisGene21343 [Stylophora pistillata]